MFVVVKYALMRFAIFFAALAIALLLGAGELLALVLALFVSAALSYVLLSKQRAQVTEIVARRVDARLAAQDKARMAAAKEREEAVGSPLDLGSPPTPVHGITMPPAPGA